MYRRASSTSSPPYQPAAILTTIAIILNYLSSPIPWLPNPLTPQLQQSSFANAFSLSSLSQPSPSCKRWQPAALIADTTRTRTSAAKLDLSPTNIIDAEVISSDDDNNNNNESATSPSSSNNLIEYSQNLDPDWKSMPIAFCDTQSNTYVDCNLAFYVKDPTTTSTLGVPCEIPIVVALELEENEDGAKNVVNLSRVIPINPDDTSVYDPESGPLDNNSIFLQDEDKEEIFQLAARALMEEFGPTIRLKRTPRVLTMEGDLDEVLGGDWRRVLWGGSGQKRANDDEMSLENMLHAYADDDADEKNGGEDFFDTIMKRDLGADYESLVDDDDDDIDEDLLKDDLNDLMDKVKDIKTELDDESEEVDYEDSSYDALLRRLQPSAALRLLNFLGPDGREYTILRPLRPILLVGKEDPDDYTRRILLTEEEKARILPRLEGACREGLEGILSGYNIAG
ncbi:hypothetical protein ACHAXH_009178 [Discostella pseudostelligera]